MDEPTHGEIQDSLILLRENVLDGETVSKIRQHLDVCGECRHEWEALQDFADRFSGVDFGLALSEALPPHIDEADLWRLADEWSAFGSEADHENWRHILRCQRCFLGIVRRSRTLRQREHIDVPDPAASAMAVWDALQLRRMQLVLTWTGVALHIAQRTPLGRSAVRRRGTLENREVTREVDQSWTVQKQFGAYTVSVQIVPQDASRQTFRLSAKLDGPVPHRVRFVFWRGTTEFVEAAVGGPGEFSISDLEPSAYRLEMMDDESGEQLGRIDLEFNGTPT
ncbi:MAG: hypothetical protein AB7N65_27195 [Vicinamibacterales bacterium]